MKSGLCEIGKDSECVVVCKVLRAEFAVARFNITSDDALRSCACNRGLSGVGVFGADPWNADKWQKL